MKIKLFFTLITVFCCLSSNAQREAANWYFGNNAGINFDINNNVTALTDGALYTEEGCTSISDNNGNLLFYTNGGIVYNKNHQVMPNGLGLNGNQSSTQSAIIIPKPQDPNIYYIFTVDTNFGGDPDDGFQYSEVDMTLDGGLGAITTIKNEVLLNKSTEKLSAVLKDCQSQNIWVVTFANYNGGGSAGSGNFNSIYAYEVSATGVNTIPVVSTLPVSISEQRGYLKFSPNGKKIACANVHEGFFICDFNLNTGVASFDTNININFRHNTSSPQSSYGLEFSPNNDFLYVSSFFVNSNINDASSQHNALLQYNLNAADISATEIVLDHRQGYRSALQLGPDGKIYRSMSETYNTGVPFLSVINAPNNNGNASNYVDSAIDLDGKYSRQGLPPFIASFFSESIDIIPTDNSNTVNLPLCTGDDYTLVADDIPGANYIWTKDGVALANNTFSLLIDTPGTYEVTIDSNTGDCSSLIGKAIVTYYDIPTASTATNIFVCDTNNDQLSDFNFSTKDAEILNGQDNTLYEVKYFTSSADANSNMNAITGTFQNTAATQTIYARIQNQQNNNCYALSQFEIGVFDSPVYNTISNITSCDDTTDGDNANGQTTTDLNALKAGILGMQNLAAFNVTFHLSQNDADTNTNPQNENYYNLTPFNVELFVRVENNLNTPCFTTGSFTLTINPVPAALDASLKQCDEDGIPDNRTAFNLNEAYNDITNSSTTATLTFYATFADATAETNPINGNNYTNTSDNQIVYVVVANTTTNCKDIAELTLQVSNSSINDYNPPAVCDELGSEDGINTFNLDTFSTAILAGLPAGININYYETFNDAALETNPLPLVYNNTTPYSQIIYGRAENGNDCFGINEIQLTINPRPQLGADELIYYCLNDFPVTATLDSGLTGNLSNYSFSWSTGEITPTIEINNIGTYTVSVSNSFGCQKTRTFTVEASEIATITQPIFINDGNNFQNVVEATVTGTGTYQYALQNQDGEIIGYQNEGLFYYIPSGIYTVLVKDIKNNCGIAQQDISVIGFPQFFTPNNDGYNDYWQVKGVNAIFQPDSDIYIFNRYGKLMTKINPLDNGWDGTYNGKPVPADDYWFRVELQDGRIYKNNFSLKR